MIPWHTFKPEQGKLLLAEPTLNDPIFSRAVILLIAHDEMGSMGLMLNKPLDSSKYDGMLRNKSIFMGGPVSDNEVYILHNKASHPGAEVILDGVYLNGEESILERITNQESEGKIFLGYCGWSKGQLDAEVSERSWIILPAQSMWVFKQVTENLWYDLIKHLGANYHEFLKYPLDVRWN
jgi:putative transcriptional regulator